MALNEYINQPGTMTYQEAVARARALVPAIVARAAAAEAQRRQPEETIREFVDAGLVRLLTPARWGGYELGFDAFVDAVIEIAKADGSAGWCYSFLVSHSWLLAQFPEQAQREVWANDPDALMATSFVPAGQATPTAGGFRLSGNWPWSSGIDHSGWCMLVGLLPTQANAPPAAYMFLVPRSDFEILDTWFAAGQRATGSKNVVVKEAFVPEHRAVDMLDLREGTTSGTAVNPGRLYNHPLFVAFPTSLVSPLLGATIGAYETWRDASRAKFTAVTREQVATLSHYQIRLAEIEVEIQAARLFLQHALDTLNSCKPITFEQRAHYHRNNAYLARLCVRAMEGIFLASGGSANYEANPLQRYWRDVHAMAAHVGFNFDAAGERFGRMELGLPPNPRDIHY